MDVTNILITSGVIGAVGLFIGIFLGVMGEKFKVEVDEKELLIRDALPGNNCGGCGYAGCDGLAAAILSREAAASDCPVGGEDMVKAISGILGVAQKAAVKEVAYVKCAGTCDRTTLKFDYKGNKDCRMLEFVPSGGPKSCSSGCLGYGTCQNVCPFDAISVINGIAVIDKEKCKACKKCLSICPRKIIEMVPYEETCHVDCNSKEKGKEVISFCEVGCIGCKKCERVCEAGAVAVKDNLAYIDPEKCTNCKACVEACPRKVIS